MRSEKKIQHVLLVSEVSSHVYVHVHVCGGMVYVVVHACLSV